MADKLSETQLEAIIGQQIELAKSHDRTERATARDKALDYYFGKMDKYVPPEANRSKVASRDVADTIGWLMPEIMRVFTASGRMFVAEPVEEEDIQYADGVSDGINYVFWKDNKGYEVVYAATWGALLHGDAIVKTFYDDTPVFGPAQFYQGLSEDERAYAIQDENVEVLASSVNKPQAPDPSGPQPGAMPDPSMMANAQGAAPMPDAPDGMGQFFPPEAPQPTYDLKVRHKKAEGTFTVVVVPLEEFLIDGDASTLEDAAFKDHWQKKTRSALVQMGYDKDDVWALPEASRNETAEAQARRNFITSDATDKSMQLVEYHECFVMVDADGDGEAEMIRACYGGGQNGKLLDWEVWEDEDPFDNIPCEPIPHRWDSRSIADEEIDIQDVKTVLWRQFLNNTYWVNNPQRFAAGKIRNPDALDNPVFGQTVFGDPGATITDLPVPYIGDKALEGIRYADEVSARRTGVNSQSMAIDPEVLQNQSATANQNATNASRSQPELIARNMAEYGWSKVGRKLLRLMNKHQTEPRTILVKGKPVQIDPKTWNPDMHVNVNTGLGTGTRDRDAAMLGQVLQQQMLFTDRIGVAFPAKALDMLPYIHNTVTRFAESTGLKNPELYWPEISQEEIDAGKQQLSQPKPDPAILLEQEKQKGAAQLAQVNAQVTMQTEQAKLQATQQADQARLQVDQQNLQAQSEAQVRREQAQLEADMQTKEADRQNALELAAQQQAADAQQQANDLAFKQWQVEQQTALEREKMANSATIAAMKPQPQPGKPNGAAAQ